VVTSRKTKDEALRSYQAFTAAHEWKFRWMLCAQRLLPKLPARVQRALIRAAGRPRFVRWAFAHYLRIAPPEYASQHPIPPAEREEVASAA
jgi:menaquinone-9 beta-reductase